MKKFKETDIVMCDNRFCSIKAGKPLLCSTKIDRVNFPNWSAFKIVLDAANSHHQHFTLIETHYEIY